MQTLKKKFKDQAIQTFKPRVAAKPVVLKPEGKTKEASAQTLLWKELPYQERRALVTKMYGTVYRDKRPESCVPQSRK